MIDLAPVVLFTAFIPGATPGKARPRVTKNGTFMPKAYRDWMGAKKKGTFYPGHAVKSLLRSWISWRIREADNGGATKTISTPVETVIANITAT